MINALFYIDKIDKCKQTSIKFLKESAKEYQKEKQSFKKCASHYYLEYNTLFYKNKTMLPTINH